MIYFDHDNRFCAGNIGSERPFYISPHLLEYGGGFQISPDENYVIYDDPVAGYSNSVLILYDVRNRSERILHVSPARSLEFPEFSPDSKHVGLLIAGYGNELPVDQEGVYLFNTATSGSQFIPLPRETELPKKEIATATMKWATNGKWLYMALYSPLSPERKEYSEYFRLDPKTSKYTHVSGKYDHLKFRHSFFDEGTTLPLHENSDGKSTFHMDLLSHNRQYRAFIDQDFELQVQGPEKQQQTVAVGKGNGRDGDLSPIAIKGWIANRYLLYTLHMTQSYVYDVRTRQTVPVLKDVKTFTWLDGHCEGGIVPKTSNARSFIVSLVSPPAH